MSLRCPAHPGASRRRPGGARHRRPRRRRARRRPRHHHPVDHRGRRLRGPHRQRPARLRRVAHHGDRHRDPRGDQRRHPDAEPAVGGGEGGAAARPARDRCPRQRDHRAGGDRDLHDRRAVAGRLPRLVRAVGPGARRRGHDAGVPRRADLRGGRVGLDRGARRGAERRRPRAARPPASRSPRAATTATATRREGRGDGRPRRPIARRPTRRPRTPTTATRSAPGRWAPACSAYCSVGPRSCRGAAGRDRRRRPGRGDGEQHLVVVAVAAVLALAPAAPAHAHASLVSTDPEEGAVLDTAPEQVVLTFNEPIVSVPDGVTVFAANGDEIASSATARDSDLVVALDGDPAREPWSSSGAWCRPTATPSPGR